MVVSVNTTFFLIRFALDSGGGDIMLRGVVQNIIRCDVVGHDRVYLLGPVYPL